MNSKKEEQLCPFRKFTTTKRVHDNDIDYTEITAEEMMVCEIKNCKAYNENGVCECLKNLNFLKNN